MSTKLRMPVLIIALLAITATVTFAQSDSTTEPPDDTAAQTLHSTHSPDELLELPVYSIEELLLLETGVVSDGRRPTWFYIDYESQWGERPARQAISTPELYVRGGRLYHHDYRLNGVPLINPISGNMTFRINPRALSEISLFPEKIAAKQTYARSTVIEMATRAGAPKWSGMVETLSDNLTGSDYDRNWYTANIGGPLPGLDKGRLFASVERRWQADREPSAISDDRLPNNWLRGWSYNGRVDYDIDNRLHLALTADGSYDEWQEYRHFFYFIPEHSPYYKDENLSLRSEITFDRSPRTSYTLGATFYRAKQFRGDGVYREDLLAYGHPSHLDGREVTNLFGAFDDPSTPLQMETYWICVDTATIDGALVCIDSVARVFAASGDETAIVNDYLRHETTRLGVDGLMTTHIKAHTITAGFELQRHTIRYYRNYQPSETYLGLGNNGFRYSNRYGYDPLGNKTDDLDWRNDAKHPINMGLYIADRIESDDLIFTPSLRLDYFSYDALQTRDPARPLDPDNNVDPDVPVLKREYLEEIPSFVRLSPRVNIEVPVDERTRLFVGAGVHYQNIPYGNLYIGHDLFERITWHLDFLPVLGTLRPEPEKITDVEVSVWHRLNSRIEMNVSAFLKKGSGLLQQYTQNSERTWYFAFRNIDECTVRGLELDVMIAVHRNLKLDLRYTNMYGEGNGPYRAPQYTTHLEPAAVSAPLDFDQRHDFAGIMRFDFGPGEGLRLGRSYPLQNSSFAAVVRLSSGLRYTPQPLTNVANERPSLLNLVESGSRNSRTMPAFASVDLRAERSFRVGSFTVVPFIWIKNLLDRKNVANVWGSSGQPDATGWLETDEGLTWLVDNATPDATGLTGEEKYRIKEAQPEYYHTPREVYCGLAVRF